MIHIFKTEIFEISLTLDIWVRVETPSSSNRIFTRISWNSNRLGEGCEKVREPVKENLKQTAANILDGSVEKTIFGKYLHREGPPG